MQIAGDEHSQHVAVALLRDGPWAPLPRETVERLAAGGRVSDFASRVTVNTEADAERFGVIVRGLLRVHLHMSDGREVTVRYVRRGGLLGGPAVLRPSSRKR